MIKIFFRRIHLYLSLAAGLVILICCLTGAILVFEKDLQMALNKGRYYVEPAAQTRSLSQLQDVVRTAYPKSKVNSIRVYEDPSRSAEFNITLPGKAEGQQAKGGPPARQPGATLFVNPYTGQILEQYSYRETVFFQVFALHRWLLGGEKSVGKYIVGISTIIFLFILITGIILWWPKNKAILLRRLKIKKDANWKRINHDFHLVFGFYSSIFLFIFAFTGLAWSFEWFNEGIYKVTNSPLKPPPPPVSAYTGAASTLSPDKSLALGRSTYANAVYYNISIPKDSAEAVTVSALSKDAPHESATDALYLDQYSGAVLGMLPFSERSLGARVRSSFKPIHTGSIGGTPTKILAFVVCLLGVTFPITGFIMWRNRVGKKKKVKAAGVKQTPVETVV
ncbi:MAG TPA: PepSY-associated TM helix domain-containing protein [Flavisolibacter sp.]